MNAHVETLRDLLENLGLVTEEKEAIQAAIAALEAQGEAVAEVGPVWSLRWIGNESIAEICRRHPALRIKSKLYLAPPSSPAMRAVVEENERLKAIINTPQADDFLRAVSTEAEHQRQRWCSDHDAGKTPADWFWLVGYLAGKALHAHGAGDIGKAEHHVITTAAALANWHRAMFGRTDMRPGIDGDAALAHPEVKKLMGEGLCSPKTK